MTSWLVVTPARTYQVKSQFLPDSLRVAYDKGEIMHLFSMSAKGIFEYQGEKLELVPIQEVQK